MKRKVLPIKGDRCLLRLLTEDDLDLTRAWRNKDRIRQRFFYSKKISDRDHRNWFDGYLARNDDYVFIIVDIDSGRPVGQVALYSIDTEAGSAEFGRLMIGDDAALGHGYALEASALILNFGFEELGLTRIFLEVFADNPSAVRLYRRLGFGVDNERDGILHFSINRTPRCG